MKRIIACLAVVLLLASCSPIDTIDASSTTPLPSMMPAQISHESFFSDPENGPSTNEVIAYCRMLIEEREQAWNDLTDCFEDSMLADRNYYYSFEYEEYYNYGESYLFKEGIVNNRLAHEAVTTESKLGVLFYEYLAQYGEIPFSSVKTYEGKNPITAYWVRAFHEEEKPIKLWFVRGSMCDVMYIESAFFSDEYDINWTIHFIPINQDWFVYWSECDEGTVSRGRLA